jgi:hypothetical protein
VVVAVAENPLPEALSPRANRLALVAVALVAIALGALGWFLPIPGGSLVAPTLTVLGVGAAIALVAWVAACFRPNQHWRWVFAAGVVGVTVIAGIWTYAFSLPMSLWFDSGATAQALAALAPLRASAQAHGGVATARPCTLQATGSIGPLRAPYQQCAVWTPEGRFVTFSAVGSSPSRGLSFTYVGAKTFADECARHLVGQWWMFTESANTNGVPGSCPIGYRYYGGP